MSVVSAELGNLEYIFLRWEDCIQYGLGGSTFEWKLPNLPQRESSTMFIQIAQLFIHYEGDGTAGNPQPQYLIYNNLFAENMYCTDKSTTVACIYSRDDATSHYEANPDSPVLQVSSNLTKISFTIKNPITTDTQNIGSTGSVMIILKVIRPQHNVVRDNLVKSYVPTEVGLPRYNRL